MLNCLSVRDRKKSLIEINNLSKDSRGVKSWKIVRNAMTLFLSPLALEMGIMFIRSSFIKPLTYRWGQLKLAERFVNKTRFSSSSVRFTLSSSEHIMAESKFNLDFL